MLYRQINDCAAHFNSASTYGSSLSGLAELWKVNGIMKCIAAKVLLTIQDLQSSWCLLIATWFLKLIFWLSRIQISCSVATPVSDI